jgi:hypothetical protein
MTFPDGSVYEGMWASGEMDGPGVLVMTDGSRYEGDFRLGKQNGASVCAGESLNCCFRFFCLACTTTVRINFRFD